MERLVLVTGGTSKIGTAICRALGDDGHKVIVTSNQLGHGTEDWAAAQIADGYRFEVVPMDVTDFVDAERGAELVKRTIGAPDILVNSSGVTRNAPFLNMTVEQWLAVMRSNLDSIFAVTRQFLAAMTAKGWGRVINVTTVDGQKGEFGQTNHTAAKAGVHGLTIALAQEMAGRGVTVNSVSPGYSATDMAGALRKETFERMIAPVSTGHLADADEVAAMVRFLCTDAAAFITGANILVNGTPFAPHLSLPRRNGGARSIESEVTSK